MDEEKEDQLEYEAGLSVGLSVSRVHRMLRTRNIILEDSLVNVGSFTCFRRLACVIFDYVRILKRT